jgi:hypothetical protein
MTKKWTIDMIRIHLSDHEGKEVILDSGDISDYTMNEIIDDVEIYVKDKGGTLDD